MWSSMDCVEKRRLLRLAIDDNFAYREALARCRVCRTCALGTTTCQLDQLLSLTERTFQSVEEHLAEHGC